jgi:hypothetical protein
MNQKVDLSADPEAREYVMALGYLFFGWSVLSQPRP